MSAIDEKPTLATLANRRPRRPRRRRHLGRRPTRAPGRRSRPTAASRTPSAWRSMRTFTPISSSSCNRLLRTRLPRRLWAATACASRERTRKSASYPTLPSHTELQSATGPRTAAFAIPTPRRRRRHLRCRIPTHRRRLRRLRHRPRLHRHPRSRPCRPLARRHLLRPFHLHGHRVHPGWKMTHG